MPTYQFRCELCGKISEKEYKIAECPKEIDCPECNKTPDKMSIAKKIIAPVSKGVVK